MAPTTKHTTSSRRIRATKLEPQTFAPFGEVAQNPATHGGRPQHVARLAGANQGSATKWLDVAHMRAFYDESGSRRAAACVVNMFVCEPRRLRERDGVKRRSFGVEILERHPFTPQMFVPLGVSAADEDARFLVIVAPTLARKSGRGAEELPPAYPREGGRRKRSLKERLLGARPNPYTNDHSSSTTPELPPGYAGPGRKGAGPPDLDNIRAFIARGDQAVTYGPGTWHAPMVVLGQKPIDFVVVQHANNVALEDCQEVEIAVNDGGEGVEVDVEEPDASPKAKL